MASITDLFRRMKSRRPRPFDRNLPLMTRHSSWNIHRWNNCSAKRSRCRYSRNAKPRWIGGDAVFRVLETNDSEFNAATSHYDEPFANLRMHATRDCNRSTLIRYFASTAFVARHFLTNYREAFAVLLINDIARCNVACEWPFIGKLATGETVCKTEQFAEGKNKEPEEKRRKREKGKYLGRGWKKPSANEKNSFVFHLLDDFHVYPEHGPIVRLTELYSDKRYFGGWIIRAIIPSRLPTWLTAARFVAALGRNNAGELTRSKRSRLHHGTD